MFNILPEFEDQYHKYVEIGKEFTVSQNVCIVGLVRNLATDLEENIGSINRLSSFVNNLSYVLYENDSEDNTKEILEKLSYEIPNFYYKSETLQLKHYTHEFSHELKSVDRTRNLAQHRNQCISYIKKFIPNTNWVIVMDLDFRKFSLDGILNSFGWLSTDFADAMVGNSFEHKYHIEHQKKIFWNYDCWAYRGSWWVDLQKYVDAYQIDPMMWFGFWQPPIGSHPIPVNSAFGGMGIYKYENYTNVKYEGYDCEHVCLHKNLYDQYPGYRLCLNPSQIMVF